MKEKDKLSKDMFMSMVGDSQLGRDRVSAMFDRISAEEIRPADPSQSELLYQRLSQDPRLGAAEKAEVDLAALQRGANFRKSGRLLAGRLSTQASRYGRRGKPKTRRVAPTFSTNRVGKDT